MNILLVCTGNTCRSPMAAAMLRQILREYGADLEQFHIVTAGLAASFRLAGLTWSSLRHATAGTGHQ